MKMRYLGIVLTSILGVVSNSFAATTTDTGLVSKFWLKACSSSYCNPGWAFQLDEGMPNAIADRSCRLQYFYTIDDNVVKAIFLAKQNGYTVSIESAGCVSTYSNGTDAFYDIRAIFVE
jgi:hypothetical protein